MATRRRHTPQVDGLDRRIDWAGASARASEGLTRWILGPGLLAVHVLIFAIVGLGMLLWNILTDPADITVHVPLLRWGIVVALHAAAVLIGRIVWGIVRPPAPRPAYQPLAHRPIAAGDPARRSNAAANGHSQPVPSGWATQRRTVVTSRSVTTMVVETARDGLNTAKRLYRRQTRSATQSGGYPQTGGAPHDGAYGGNGAHPPVFSAWPEGPLDADAAGEPGSGWSPNGRPGTSWTATVSQDEVISVTQIDRGGDHGPDDRSAGTDPVRSWLDGYLDGAGGERDARWTWVEAAASTWLARGEADPAAIETSGSVTDGERARPTEARVVESRPRAPRPSAPRPTDPRPAKGEAAPPAGPDRRPATNGLGASPE